jgi:hypothetical protein
MFDHTHAGGDQRVRDWLVQRPRLTLWVVIAIAAATVVLVLASAHHSGVTMLTPGKKAEPFALTTLHSLIQAPLAFAQASAASRQADARA